MRTVPRPLHKFSDVYDSCVAGFSDANARADFLAVKDHVMAWGNQYHQHAERSSLHAIAVDRKKNDALLVGSVSKQKMKDLYSIGMVRQPSGRKIYDELLAAARNGICPTCGFGVATTLDHYLPKSLFPLGSVLPINLVPACRDCNLIKQASFGQAEEMHIHPYLDDKKYFHERWLFAEIIQEHPPSVRFFIRPPQAWSEVEKSRLRSHFDDLELSRRYAVVAADELAATSDTLDILCNSEDDRRHYLDSRSKNYLKQNANSWLGALLYAMGNDYWYLNVGFKLR